MHFRTKGIVLKKENLGEADQLFTIYTNDFGKLEVLGRSIRKIKSKLRSGINLFYLSEIEFIEGKIYRTLTDALAIEKFVNLKKDLKRLKIAYQVSELLDNLVKGQETDEKIWQLLKETFEKLNLLKKTEIIYYYFFWNLVSLLGYQPEIRNCSFSGKKINCDIIKIIKVILRRDWQILARLKLEPDHLKLLKSVSKWYKLKICG